MNKETVKEVLELLPWCLAGALIGDAVVAIARMVFS